MYKNSYFLKVVQLNIFVKTGTFFSDEYRGKIYFIYYLFKI